VCEFGCGPGLPSIAAAAALDAAAAVVRAASNSSMSGVRSNGIGNSNSKVYATDVDRFALQLVRAAARDQDLSHLLVAVPYDLLLVDDVDVDSNGGENESDGVDVPPSPPPRADLYLLSDVFESSDVARGAARVVRRILLSPSPSSSKSKSNSSKVWVFAQSDRVQREVFLEELKKYCRSRPDSLRWRPYEDGPPQPHPPPPRRQQLSTQTTEEEDRDRDLSYAVDEGRLWLCDIDETTVPYG